MNQECHQCRVSEDEAVLQSCRVCHKRFCENHSTQRSGAEFCSLGCATYFFHSDDDDED